MDAFSREPLRCQPKMLDAGVASRRPARQSTLVQTARPVAVARRSVSAMSSEGVRRVASSGVVPEPAARATVRRQTLKLKTTRREQ